MFVLLLFPVWRFAMSRLFVSGGVVGLVSSVVLLGACAQKAAPVENMDPVPLEAATITEEESVVATDNEISGGEAQEKSLKSASDETVAEAAPVERRESAAAPVEVAGLARAPEADDSSVDYAREVVVASKPRPSGRVAASPPPARAATGAGVTLEAGPARVEQSNRQKKDGVQAAPPPPPPSVVVVEVPLANTEEYTDHGVNPFTLPDQDRFSTFSIDVDTASYTVSRRKLQEGTLPPEAAVRAEEFINFFHYDSYMKPSKEPFAVSMEAMPDPFRSGRHILRVGVQGKDVSRAERAPLHLTFLVDVSGSMASSDKLPMAKRSLHKLVDSLEEKDTVALATYAGRVAKILEPTNAANKRAIHDAIERLDANGSTAMSAGIDLAYGMAMESFRPGHENRVVVMSDGDANVGATSFDSMLSQIKGYADKGVTLSTIGFGMGNYRDSLMEQLANKGDGNNFYIDSDAQAQRVFVEELGSTMLTIARDVKIQVEFNPEAVTAYRLVGYENRAIADKDFRNDRVDAGEVGAGHSVTALYEVMLKDGYAQELATVRMRYEAPGADKAAIEKAFAFQGEALRQAPAQASKDTQIAYAAGPFAEILRGSPNAAEIDLNALIRYAKAAARPGQKDDMELVKLMEKAQELGAGRRSLPLTQR